MEETINKKYVPLIWLSRFGGLAYKKDFFMLLPEDNSARLYKWYKEQKYIVEYEVPKEKDSQCVGDTETVVSLTTAGLLRKKLVDETDSAFFTEKTRKINSDFFNSKTKKRGYSYSYLDKYVYPFLNDTTVRIMFHVAGTRIDPSEKPSLQYLYENTLSDFSLLHENNVVDGYLDKKIDDNADRAKKTSLCKEYLCSGIYYTKDEFRELDKAINGDSAPDVYKSIKWQGIFISAGTLLVVCIASGGKLLKNERSAIENLIAKLNTLIVDNINPDVNRVLDITAPNNKSYINHGIGALVITSGPSMIHTIATNPLKYDTENRVNTSYELLDGASSFYSQVYCVPTTYDGLTQLYYITHRSVEKWRKEASLVLNKANMSERQNIHFQNIVSIYEEKDGERVTESTFFHAIHDISGCDTLYLPVYEATTLYQLSKLGLSGKLNLLILTQASMTDTISRILRLGNTYGSSDEIIAKFKTDLRFGIVEPVFGHRTFNYSATLGDLDVQSNENTFFISSAQSKSYKNNQYASVLRKDVLYELIRLLNLDEYYIYDVNGQIDGKAKLEAFALEHDKDLVLKSKHKKEQTVLFNSISKGTLSLDAAFNNTKYNEDYGYSFVDHIEKKHHVVEHRHTMSFSVTTSNKKLIEEAARKAGVTVSKYVNQVISEHVRKNNNSQ